MLSLLLLLLGLTHREDGNGHIFIVVIIVIIMGTDSPREVNVSLRALQGGLGFRHGVSGADLALGLGLYRLPFVSVLGTDRVRV